jgi:hypothetical protein
MAGQIKALLDRIVVQLSKGDPVLASYVEVKLILRGVDPAKYTAESADDPAVIAKIRAIAHELKAK